MRPLDRRESPNLSAVLSSRFSPLRFRHTGARPPRVRVQSTGNGLLTRRSCQDLWHRGTFLGSRISRKIHRPGWIIEMIALRGAAIRNNVPHCPLCPPNVPCRMSPGSAHTLGEWPIEARPEQKTQNLALRTTIVVWERVELCGLSMIVLGVCPYCPLCLRNVPSRMSPRKMKLLRFYIHRSSPIS